MFTGIVTDVGVVDAVAAGPGGVGKAFRIASAYAPETIAVGASIACAGVCLTATAITPGAAGGAVFQVDVSPETLDRTTAGCWAAGTRINLERSLRLGDELGGHIVTGHIDAVAEIAARSDDGETARFEFRAPAKLMPLIAEKGSVALDGTSLTVNGVTGETFTVTMIPHTLSVTTWGASHEGNRVNLEVDMLARYVARLRETEALRAG